MRSTSEHVQEILCRFASVALPMAILGEALERETITTTGGAERVLGALKSCPDLFRVLDPGVGPWRGRSATTGGGRGLDPRHLGAQHPPVPKTLLGGSGSPGREPALLGTSSGSGIGDGHGTMVAAHGARIHRIRKFAGTECSLSWPDGARLVFCPENRLAVDTRH